MPLASVAKLIALPIVPFTLPETVAHHLLSALPKVIVPVPKPVALLVDKMPARMTTPPVNVWLHSDWSACAKLDNTPSCATGDAANGGGADTIQRQRNCSPDYSCLRR